MEENEVVKVDENQVSGELSTTNSILEEIFKKQAAGIYQAAEPLLDNETKKKKHAQKLADNVEKSLQADLDEQALTVAKKQAKTKAEKKAIQIKLYQLNQEEKRVHVEEKFKKKQQKEQHKAENNETYWNNHGATLSEYKMHKGSNRVFCNILLALDGIKGFLNGLSKVSNALIGALKWILIIGVALAVLMIIPVTREWLLNLLGFIKK